MEVSENLSTYLSRQIWHKNLPSWFFFDSSGCFSRICLLSEDTNLNDWEQQGHAFLACHVLLAFVYLAHLTATLTSTVVYGVANVLLLIHTAVPVCWSGPLDWTTELNYYTLAAVSIYSHRASSGLVWLRAVPVIVNEGNGSNSVDCRTYIIAQWTELTHQCSSPQLPVHAAQTLRGYL